MAIPYEELKPLFREEIMRDKTAQKLYEIIASGRGTYKTASLYAAQVGDDIGRVLRRNGFMIDGAAWNIDELIPQTLGYDHAMVVNACRQVQTAMNADASIGVKFQEPKFDVDRALGIVQELRDNPEFTNISNTFYDQLTNFSMNVADESIRANAEQLYRSGIRSMVIRQAEANCCDWCDEVAGSYDYQEVDNSGNDVWRRHENCRCTIDFITVRNGTGYTERVNNQKK